MFYSRYFLIDDIRDFGGAEMLSDISKELLYSENGDSLFLRNMFNAGRESSDSEDEIIDQELFDDFWAENERRKNHRRSKHNKKASRRKGSAKRFRDRSRKAAHEEHLYKVYSRGLAGDWNRRGRRLEEAGATSTKVSHHKAASGEYQRPMGINLHISNVYYPDGSQISVEMGSEDWYSYVGELATLKKRIEQEEQERQERLEHQKWDFWDWEADYDFDDCDPWEDELECASFEMDTDEFTAQELADFMQKLASATPEQRAMVRRFFSKNF